MKKWIPAITIAILTVSSAVNVLAKNYNLVFWYPGEAGGTAEAQPIIDTFFDYINKKLKGEKFSGKYFNTTSEGIIYIKKTKPDFGIASWIALIDNNSTIPEYSVLAKTLPLPDGKTTNQFYIVGINGGENGEWTPPENYTVYSSLPMSLAFFKANLAPDIRGNVTIKTTSTLLVTLKQIASEAKTDAAALLTPTEKYTLDNMNADWKSNLATIYTCRPIPTAELIHFGGKPEVSGQLLNVLENMPNDPEGKEILDELRLKGFEP